MEKPVVIGIAGGSGSGKSTVLTRLVELVGRHRVCLLDHDSYYRDLSHLEFEARAAFNFEHPDALETDLMRRQLDELLTWRSIEKQVYVIKNHFRPDVDAVYGTRSVILV